MNITPSRIGFIATHLNGLDRVSLESVMWSRVLTEMGHECFFFAGESTQPEERTVIVPEADSRHPDIRLINQELYDDSTRSSKTSGTIQALRFHIKQHLHQFIQTFDIRILIVENALSLPINIPLGLALTELIAETGIPTLARHHEFAWERSIFLCSPADDYIRSGFPPKLPSIQHIVATRFHADALAQRAGVRVQTVPYVFDFDHPMKDDHISREDLLRILGMEGAGTLMLATSPLLPSSKIETMLALLARIPDQPVFLLTGSQFDSDSDYVQFLQETAEMLGLSLHFFNEDQGQGSGKIDERDKFLVQCYQHASLVGNMGETQHAFAGAVEAFFYRLPVLTPSHSIVTHELKQSGFQLLSFGSFPDRNAAQLLTKALSDQASIERLVEHNYELGNRYFSMNILRNKLDHILREDLTSSPS